MSVLVIAADLAAPTQAANALQPAASAAPAPSAEPAPAASTTNPSGFNAVNDQKEMQSGEALLIEAYIAIWVLLFAFIVIAWKRTRKAEDKIAELEKAIERVKTAPVPVPSTKRSASEPPADPEKA